ncbi:AMP-binding protein [Streptomyces sp. NPDC059446]|uniref:AMP-binding protein n=1 Tax=Streptomyces sp. NPDC059446 TaxID=3346833 RepID=UPI0036C66EB0
MTEHARPGPFVPLVPSDRTAVEWCGHRLTYAELASAVDELTGLLVERGAPHTHVLVLGPLSPAYVVGLLATLRCGAVPVPVDAGLTPGQYEWTERTAQPSAVISSDVSTAGHYRGALPADEFVLAAATGRVVLDTPVRGVPRTVRRHASADAGYLIPTSGSTGSPKAIVGSRTGLHTFLSWFTEEFALDGADVCAAVTRVNFDPSLRELLAVLAVGGKLCLPAPDAQLDLKELARHLVSSRATTVFLVPSLARRIADVLRAESLRLDDLRLGFFAGEVLPPRVVARWAGLAPRAEWVNLYGTTEGTLSQLFRRDAGAATGSSAHGVPVGRPRPGISVEVEEPDADGCGEVLITSPAPALGVLGEGDGPEPGTFPVRPLGAVLRTGDSGFFTPQGELMIAGRVGNDLKVSGRRVSYHRFVDEVEALPGVRQCVVVDRDGPQAYVSVDAPAEGRAPSPAAAVREIARRLGLPRPGVHPRAELPLLRSGKVDRMALAASPAGTDPAGDAGPGGAPAGQGTHPGETAPGQEADVTGTLRSLLRLDDGLPATTAFVDAGLTSLDLMEFALEAERRFGVRLSVQDCFRHRDLASLARTVERTRGAAPLTAQAPGPDTGSDSEDTGTHPLSTRQWAYQALCMAHGNANWCNISRETLFDRIVTPAEVRAAAEVLLARHDVLRLALTPDGTRQTHTPAAALGCPVTLHRDAPPDGGSAADHRERVQQARVRAVSELLDPTAPPVLRLVVVQGPGITSVLVVVHHLFVDGLSLDLLVGELRSLLRGEPPGDAPDPRSYRDYCRATERVTRPYAPEAGYWNDLLKGAAQVELPAARGADGRAGMLVSRPFGLTGSRAAHRIAARSGVSVFAVVLAAYEAAVARTFGLGPLTVVVPVQVRHGVRSGAAGMFTSQLVVRAQGPDELDERAREFARQLDAGAAAGAWEFDQRAADAGLADAECFPFSTVLFNQHPRERGLRVRDLGDWRPRPLGRELRYQLQGELQMSAAEMVLTYYYRQEIAVDRPDVIDRVHADVVAALCAAERTTGA